MSAAVRRESQRRLRWGALLLLATLVACLGFAWDVSWHADVGPDTFFSPPHSLMYSGVAAGGLICLWMLARTTLACRQGRCGVTADNTTPWLAWRAPLGFVVAGLGSVVFLGGGLFDLWWHTLYGFDVTEVSPPHFFIAFGALIQSLGVVYVFAVETTQARRVRHDPRPFLWAELGFATGMGLFLTEFCAFLTIGLTEWLRIGPFIGYGLMIATILPLCLVCAVSFLRLPGSATLVAGFAGLLRLVMWYGIPPAVALQAGALGLPYRVNALKFSISAFSIPPGVLLVGLVIDLMLIARLSARTSPPAAAGAPVARATLAAAVAITLNHLADPRWLHLVDAAGARLGPEGVARYLADVAPAQWPTLLAVPLLGALAALAGWHLGIQFRYTAR